MLNALTTAAALGHGRNLDANRIIETPTIDIAYPGDRCCVLYDRPDFGGLSKKFCYKMNGDLEQTFLTADRDFDNMAEAFYCGKNVEYDLCVDTDPSLCDDTGEARRNSKGAGTVMNWNFGVGGWGNVTSLLRLRYYDPSINGAVITFN